MPLDPLVDDAQQSRRDPAARTAATVADLERRIAALEQNRPVVQVGDGAPTADPTKLREGTPYIDRTNRRAYYVVSGVWRYATLT